MFSDPLSPTTCILLRRTARVRPLWVVPPGRAGRWQVSRMNQSRLSTACCDNKPSWPMTNVLMATLNPPYCLPRVSTSSRYLSFFWISLSSMRSSLGTRHFQQFDCPSTVVDRNYVRKQRVGRFSIAFHPDSLIED